MSLYMVLNFHRYRRCNSIVLFHLTFRFPASQDKNGLSRDVDANDTHFFSYRL